MKRITNGTIASTKCARLHLKNAWEKKKTEVTKTITHETHPDIFTQIHIYA